MERKDFIKVLSAGGAALGLSAFTQEPSKGAEGDRSHENLYSGQKPNIVYIFADDIGYGDIGAYGQEKIETPNIDSLAKGGMKFTQHYAEPVCAPSRCGLMTGQNPGHAYIRGNDEWGERGNIWSYEAMEANPALEGQLPIPDSTDTVAGIFKKAGYKTAITGKWGLGGPFTTGIPNNQGFDYFYGFLCQREDHTYYPGHLWENEFRVPLNNEVMSPAVKFPKKLDPSDPKNYEKYSQSDYAPKYIINATLKFIQQNKDYPFFLYFPSPLPHASMQAPQRWIDYYLKKFGTDEKPYLGGGYFPCRYPRATRAAMVSTLDEHVGKIVRKLKELGLYENTLIIFSSDNGASAEGGADISWFNSNGPFRGGKRYVYEGGIREPFIASWPSKIKPDSQSDLICAEWDFLPMVCQLTGEKPSSDIQGISYLPTLLGRPEKQKEHDYLYWEFPQFGGQQAVRMGKWKGVRMGIMSEGNLDIQLFNLKNDIEEQHDVSSQHPDVVKKIKQIMEQEHQLPKVDQFRMEALDRK